MTAAAAGVRKGRARITVRVPGPGTLELARTKRLKRVRRRVDEGTVKHPVRPTRRAKKELREDGPVKVTAKLTFTPEGGRPSTERTKIRLRKR